MTPAELDQARRVAAANGYAYAADACRAAYVTVRLAASCTATAITGERDRVRAATARAFGREVVPA